MQRSGWLRLAGAMEDYRGWARAALDVLERGLNGKQYLLGTSSRRRTS